MATDFAKIVGRAFRDKEKLITGVTQHLFREVDNGRRTGYLHPSALSSEGFCPRAAYYDISGAPTDPTPRNLAFEMVFERGHDSHGKWQDWFWEMGDLRGMFGCQLCHLYWYDRSPWSCPRCEAGIDMLEYREVPVFNEEFGIRGQADGDVWHLDRWKFIEVKTIGIGTLRWDAPALLEQYSFAFDNDHGEHIRGIDIDGLWSSIRRPFPPHIRQGMIYCFCADRREIVYLYEPKFATAWPKEFEMKFRRDLIQDQLDNCIKVKDHLEMQRPPKRPIWAEKQHKQCKQCPFKSTCYSIGK